MSRNGSNDAQSRYSLFFFLFYFLTGHCYLFVIHAVQVDNIAVHNRRRLSKSLGCSVNINEFRKTVVRDMNTVWPERMKDENFPVIYSAARFSSCWA